MVVDLSGCGGNFMSDSKEKIADAIKETRLTKEELKERVLWYKTNDPSLLSFKARLIEAFNSDESLDEGEIP